MKQGRCRPRAALTIAVGCLSLAVPVGAQKHYSELTFPPLKDIEVPSVHREELDNGLVLYLLADHTLPMVEGLAMIRTGDVYEPAAKVGLAGILSTVMRTGGSTTRPGEEIDRLLENVGASVETSIGTASGSASLFALKENLPLVLEILAEILRRPALPDDKLELAKVQARSAIARRNDSVMRIAGREFQRLLYGPESPYGRIPEYATIEAVSRDDLVDFHERYFHPNYSILGLWGDFELAEVRDLVNRHFGSWPKTDLPPPSPPPVATEPKGSVNLVVKDDVNQTHIRIGHLDGTRKDPDYFALELMSEVLGGGFSSRLFRRVRTELGLAYSVSAAWNAGWTRPGTFAISSATKSESTVAAIQEILREVRRISEKPVGDEELKLARESILSSFVFNFDTTDELVERLMVYEYQGYPKDFLETYRENIEKVTVPDILRAARRNVQPVELVILAVGREEDFDQPLSVLGEVRRLDITIPEPPADSGAAASSPSPPDGSR